MNPLEFEMKLKYRQIKAFKRMIGKNIAYEISYGRKLIKYFKDKYGAEKMNINEDRERPAFVPLVPVNLPHFVTEEKTEVQRDEEKPEGWPNVDFGD